MGRGAAEFSGPVSSGRAHQRLRYSSALYLLTLCDRIDRGMKMLAESI